MKRYLLWAFALLLLASAAGAVYLRTRSEQQTARWLETLLSRQLERTVSIKGGAKIEWSPSFRITFRGLRVANAAWGKSKALFAADQGAVQLPFLPLLLGGSPEITLLELSGAQLNLERNRMGRGNWEFGEDSADHKAAQPVMPCGTLPEIRQLLIVRGLVSLPEGVWPNSVLIEDAGLDAVESGTFAASFSGSLNGVYLNASGELHAEDDRDLKRISARANTDDTSVEVDAALHAADGACSIEAALQLRGTSLAKLNELYPASLPDIGPYSISTTFSNPGRRWEFADIALKVRDSDLRGRLQLDSQPGRLAISGSLSSELLAIQDFTPEPAAQPPIEEEDSAKPGPIFTDAPIPLQVLQQTAMLIDLTAVRMLLDPVTELGGVELKLHTDERQAELELGRAALFGGSASTRAVFSRFSERPLLELHSSLQQVELGRLLGSPEEVQAKADLQMRITAEGATPRELASSAGGWMSLIALNGSFESAALSLLSTGLQDVLLPIFGGSSGSRLHCLISRFDIENGIAKSAAFTAHAANLGIVGRGAVDLRKETADLSFRMTSDNAGIADLLVPFTARGPLHGLKVLPDLVESGSEAAGAPVGLTQDAEGGLGGTAAALLQSNNPGELSPLCREALEIAKTQQPEGA